MPESLVALYMQQVLQGLLYLHNQGVVHRDLKGSNLLSTKSGAIKLADFGVATKTSQANETTIVGTPYWMAPEIIQLAGASTASDIWSVGCTILELLTGSPPYFQLSSLSALFRIVNDEHPPIPANVSSAAFDFLLQCFQKDPNLRVPARKLLSHPWLSTSSPPFSEINQETGYPKLTDISGAGVIMDIKPRAAGIYNLSHFKEDDNEEYETVLEGFDELTFEANPVRQDEVCHLFKDNSVLLFEPMSTRCASDDNATLFSLGQAPAVCDASAMVFSDDSNYEVTATLGVLSTHDYSSLIKIIQSTYDQDRVFAALRHLNTIHCCMKDLRLLCTLAVIPVMLKLSTTCFRLDIRVEVALFMERLLRPTAELTDLFLAGGGLSILKQFMCDYSVARTPLAVISLESFIRLSLGLESIMKAEVLSTAMSSFRSRLACANILEFLSWRRYAQTDQILFLMESVSASQFTGQRFTTSGCLLTVLLNAMRFVPGPTQLRIIKLLRGASMRPKNLEAFSRSNSVKGLTRILKSSIPRKDRRELMNHALNVLYNVCHLSRFRQNQAARAGCIPILQQIVAKSLTFRQFAIPILFSMIQSGERAREEVWRNCGVDFLSVLIMDRYWQTGCMGAFSAWLRDDREKVEPRLLLSNFVQTLRHTILKMNVHEFQSMLQSLKEVLSACKIIRRKFFSDDVLRKIIFLLHNQEPLLRVTTLKLLSLAGEHSAWIFSPSIRRCLHASLRLLVSEENSIIVQNLARHMLHISAPAAASLYRVRRHVSHVNYF
ncbi:hypothetical protein BJ508DRAFT_414518 [Ascobolus immersus RN42]|uniref:mitogen-activated protein kinase n=1 Tax=Ascobolus immersus RN42 TaxID=1160509 RepID=A0A3N4IAW2_ASCIM|nr:hypothetical protein BJ508DRAFT_414518 [Ascobolus immersus RN42]